MVRVSHFCHAFGIFLIFSIERNVVIIGISTISCGDRVD